jgi:hypothetical protein
MYVRGFRFRLNRVLHGWQRKGKAVLQWETDIPHNNNHSVAYVIAL